MQLPTPLTVRANSIFSSLHAGRSGWWEHWRELADYLLPRRYVSLLSPNDTKRRERLNDMIFDPTGTTAIRILASGMMNGITSPSRPWFKLGIAGLDDSPSPAREWLDTVEQRMMMEMARTNFYNAMASMYLDLATFGSAAVLIYENPRSVFRCYNPPVGEFYFAQSAQLAVDTFAREFLYTVRQTVERFGIENVSDHVKNLYNMPNGSGLNREIVIRHLIEPNTDGKYPVKKKFAYREIYWERSAPEGLVLEVAGYNECPGAFPRYEVMGNDPYGTSPGMDMLPEVKQLQQMTKDKAIAVQRLARPPLLADESLRNSPKSLLPNGITYVRNASQIGMKPIYTVNPPLDQMTADIREIQQRIQIIAHNDLFKMISQLDTVRSATEIDARREEKLVLLGPVLERFENEALNPILRRIYSIMMRYDLFPPPPEDIAGRDIQIEYISILTTAQKALGAAPLERWIAFIGQISGIYPGAVNVPDFETLIRDYAISLGVGVKNIRTVEEVADLSRQQQELAATREAAAVGGELVKGAKLASETDVGGGANALQTILEGVGGG